MVNEDTSRHPYVQSKNTNENYFQGFIRVYMNLMRPISMSLSRPLSIYDVVSKDIKETQDSSTTSFYLPKDTTKVIHISSDTSTQEVITILLQKFNITDNPHKFALYEKITEIDDHSKMRRITNGEFPLEICLSWTSEGLHNHVFVLQENDTQEVVWDAFSVPELENFLKILDREEHDYVEQIKAKYNLLHIQISHQVSTLQENERQSRSSSLGVNKISKAKEKTIKLSNDGQGEVFV